MKNLTIKQINGDELQTYLDDLSAIVSATVEGGAAISFMQPFNTHDAASFWNNKVFPEVEAGNRVLLAALIEGKVVGTVQLETTLPPNQPHRCEVAKMAVHPSARRQGVAKALMLAVEDEARKAGKTLITLDTRTGDNAQKLYASLGYEEAGTIPQFALDPDGAGLHPTTYMYKLL